MPVVKGLDFLAPAIAAGHALHRVGCFLAGDGCYGTATSLPWGMAFPDGTVPINIPVHPTMVYEAVLMVPLFVCLWWKRRQWPAGISISLCLVTIGIVAFFLQFIHLAPEVAWGLTEAQLFSLIIVPAGAWKLASTWHGSETQHPVPKAHCR